MNAFINLSVKFSLQNKYTEHVLEHILAVKLGKVLWNAFASEIQAAGTRGGLEAYILLTSQLGLAISRGKSSNRNIFCVNSV
jgi:hypothetical protein